MASVDEDGVLSGPSLLANDIDPEGDGLTINTTPVSDPSHGTLVINADGTYTYTPDENFSGEDGFTYEVCDNGTPKECSSANVTITVNPTNTAPVAIDDEATVDEGEVLAGTSLLANDLDVDGDDLTINTTPVSEPTDGILIINSDGTYTYTPDEGFAGEDSFEYEVCDNGTPQACAIATVFINVIDTDNDDDGISNEEEGDGDTDGDGIPDKDDIDSDDDGLSDEEEGNVDTDGDGTPDYKDEDSDNDTIKDEDEGGDDIDGDGDGNYRDLDSDDDGISDEDERDIDTDGDLIPNYLDEDSDDDGILDNKESQGDCDNDGIVDYIDTDKCYSEDDLTLYEGFSPNNDGDNDTYQIPWLTQYKKVSVEIFNRWGNVVYRQSKYENNWNGESNVGYTIGKNLPVGTYFYIIHIHDIDKKLNGYIYLNR